MPWYAWLALILGIAVLLFGAMFRALRASRRGRRFLALSTRGKLRFGRELLRDPQTPLPAKIALGLLAGYLALPFDLIPDFIPVLGQVDDLLVVVGVVGLLIVLIPRARFERALDLAAGEVERVGDREARSNT